MISLRHSKTFLFSLSLITLSCSPIKKKELFLELLNQPSKENLYFCKTKKDVKGLSNKFGLNKKDDRLKDLFTKNKRIKTKLKAKDNYSSLKKDNINIVKQVQSYIAFKNINLKDIDKIILWNLIQLINNPISSSPNSKFQTYININGNKNYYEFLHSRTDDEKNHNVFPFIYGLEYLLKAYKSQLKLENLAKILDLSIMNKVNIGNDFADFLYNNRDEILKKKNTFAPYILNEKPLQHFNQFPTFNFTQFIKNYRKSKKQHDYKKLVKINSKLFKYFDKKDQTTSTCNYDLDLYKRNIILIEDSSVKSNFYSFNSAVSQFLGNTSLRGSNLNLIENTHLFTGTSNTIGAAYCTFSLSHNGQESTINAMSFKDRDNRQVLQYLYNNISSLKNLSKYIKLLKSPRKNVYTNPKRIISELHDVEQNESFKHSNVFNNLNLPTYYYQNLGNIWSFTDLKTLSELKNFNSLKKTSKRNHTIKFVYDLRSNIFSTNCN
jgi:hypothetical protein